MAEKTDRLVSLSGCKSEYDASYYCNITGVTFGQTTVWIHFDAHGNGSLGELQHPSESTLIQTTKDKGTIYHYVTDIEMTKSDECSEFVGKMAFNSKYFSEFSSYTFTYGSGGYAPTTLFTINAEFIQKNSLESFFTKEKQVEKTVPLSGCKSEYNAEYYCNITSITFTWSHLWLQFDSIGDNSLGPLQDSLESQINETAGDQQVTGHPSVGCSLSKSDPQQVQGKMAFETESFKLNSCFKFFYDEGYTEANLFTLNQEFIEKNQLQPFFNSVK